MLIFFKNSVVKVGGNQPYSLGFNHWSGHINLHIGNEKYHIGGYDSRSGKVKTEYYQDKFFNLMSQGMAEGKNINLNEVLKDIISKPSEE